MSSYSRSINAWTYDNEINTSTRTPVIFNHSATIDDIVSMALLSTMSHIDLLAVTVTFADTIPESAMNLTYKVYKYLNLSCALGACMEARGYNSFPNFYKIDSTSASQIPSLESFPNLSPPYLDGMQIMHNLLSKAYSTNKPITLVVTGPLTAISMLIKKDPMLIKGIDKLIWMGGVIINDKVRQGNVVTSEMVSYSSSIKLPLISVPPANTCAEWNVFWDPFATQYILKVITNIHIFPLNSTNKISVQPILKMLQHQSTKSYLSRLCYQLYELTTAEPFYRMWNTFTVGFLANLSNILAKPQYLPVEISLYNHYIHDPPTHKHPEVKNGQGQGCMIISSKTNVNHHYFYLDLLPDGIENWYRYFLQQMFLY